jgi:ribonuclease HI
MKTREDKHISHPLKLYTDGGVISKNPSPYGGTWAWVLVKDDQVLAHASGLLTPSMIEEYSTVTNNQSELYAILMGLKHLNYWDVVEVCSDSNVSLGRVFRWSSLSNIPKWMVTMLLDQKGRFSKWKQFSYTLMDGHPTKAHLASGIGKRGHPVSRWNKLCDDLCRAEAENYWKDKNK